MKIVDIQERVASISSPIRLLADRYNGGAAASRVFVYAAGGYCYPGKGTQELRDEMNRYLDAGDRTVKIKIGGAPLAEDLGRIGSVLSLWISPAA